MLSIIKATTILMLVSIIGCGKDDQPVKAADTRVLKTQLEALEQAKQVEQVTREAAEMQRQRIEQATQ